jgi:hypothetical protein
MLHLQGLPFAIAGVGDLLALFRCVSCRYRFSTDVTRPALMGAIGRVYSSCEVRSCTRSWWPQQQQQCRPSISCAAAAAAAAAACRHGMRPAVTAAAAAAAAEEG